MLWKASGTASTGKRRAGILPQGREGEGRGRLTLVPFRKFPMAKRVDRMKPKVLLFSNWSIPSFRSKSGSATSFQLKKKLEEDDNVDFGFTLFF